MYHAIRIGVGDFIDLYRLSLKCLTYYVMTIISFIVSVRGQEENM